MAAQRGHARLTGDDWGRLRAVIAMRAFARGCPPAQVEFVTSTTLLATWVAETLDRVSESDADTSVTGWAWRLLDALICAYR